jgi:hypothetical protein
MTTERYIAVTRLTEAAAQVSAPITLAVQTALSRTVHQARTLILTAGGHQLTLDWAATGDGFGCILENEAENWCYPVLTGFTVALPIGASGVALATGLRPGGMAALLCRALPDGSRVCRVIGQAE